MAGGSGERDSSRDKYIVSYGRGDVVFVQHSVKSDLWLRGAVELLVACKHFREIQRGVGGSEGL